MLLIANKSNRCPECGSLNWEDMEGYGYSCQNPKCMYKPERKVSRFQWAIRARMKKLEQE